MLKGKVITEKGEELSVGNYYKAIPANALEWLALTYPSYEINGAFVPNEKYLYFKGDKPKKY